MTATSLVCSMDFARLDDEFIYGSYGDEMMAMVRCYGPVKPVGTSPIITGLSYGGASWYTGYNQSAGQTCATVDGTRPDLGQYVWYCAVDDVPNNYGGNGYVAPPFGSCVVAVTIAGTGYVAAGSQTGRGYQCKGRSGQTFMDGNGYGFPAWWPTASTPRATNPERKSPQEVACKSSWRPAADPEDRPVLDLQASVTNTKPQSEGGFIDTEGEWALEWRGDGPWDPRGEPRENTWFDAHDPIEGKLIRGQVVPDVELPDPGGFPGTWWAVYRTVRVYDFPQVFPSLDGYNGYEVDGGDVFTEVAGYCWLQIDPKKAGPRGGTTGGLRPPGAGCSHLVGWERSACESTPPTGGGGTAPGEGEGEDETCQEGGAWWNAVNHLQNLMCGLSFDLGSLLDLVRDLIDAVLGLPGLIADAIRALFVPDEGLGPRMERIREEFEGGTAVGGLMEAMGDFVGSVTGAFGSAAAASGCNGPGLTAPSVDIIQLDVTEFHPLQSCTGPAATFRPIFYMLSSAAVALGGMFAVYNRVAELLGWSKASEGAP